MTRLRLFYLFVILLLSQLSVAQDLIINYTDPPGLTVCDNHTFEFTLTNTSTDSLFGVAVTVNTPTGLEYIPGSVTTGTEQNISNPSAPVFSFPTIPPTETISFTIDTELKCPLVNSINSGVLFTNIINATWNGGTNSITTLPYVIETPLLVITDATNTVSSGSQGDVIIRTITIQNTRLGALTSFNFSDNHGGGISISSPLGTVINQTANSFELQLTGTDFMTIGDGDALFELDEVIVITEFVTIIDCGVTIPSSNSLYSISWGCFNDACQTEVFPALIDLIPADINPELMIEVDTELPTDFCGGQDVQHVITITNAGSYEALDIEIDLLQGLTIDQVTGAIIPAQSMAFDPNSFSLDSAGIITSVTPTTSFPANFNCNMPNGYFRRGQFYFPSLAAGESMTLTWNYAYCRVGCDASRPTLEYGYSYLRNCPAEVRDVFATNALDVDLGEKVLTDSMFYFFGQPLVNGSNSTLNYVLESTKLLGDGILNIEFDLPCGFGWGGSSLEMGGQFPFDVDVQTSGGNTTVVAQYNLPMNADSVMTSFDLTFNCDAQCGPGGGCVEPYITASGMLGCGSTSIIGMEVTLQEDPSVPLECSMKICRLIPLLVECEAEFPGSGMGDLAFLFFNTDFERCNFGEADNDDNRLPDPTGGLNMNIVRKDRAIPGDTVTTILNGAFAFPTGQFPVDVEMMTVQFEAHTVDAGLNGGVTLDFDINGSLFASGGIAPISAAIKIVDASTGDVFLCDIGDPTLVVDSIPEDFRIVNTEPVQLIDEILYNQYKYNTTLANMAGCVPAGFEYDQGDSIILIAKHRMLYNPLPQNSDLPPIVNMRASVIPVFCNDFNIYIAALPEAHEKFQYSGYKYEILPGNYQALPCDPFSSPGEIGARFVLGEDNFFPFEYRPLASLDAWRLNFPDAVNVLESKLLRLSYQQQGDNVYFNENLNFMINPPFIEFDVGGFHTPTLDEGWEMFFFHEFEFDCVTTAFEATIYDVDFTLNESLPEPSFVNLQQEEGVFINAGPDINLGVTLANFTGFDNQSSWELVLINPSSGINLPADNAWMQPISSTGLMTNFELINTTTGQVVPQINGIFQLGTINLNEIVNYELFATNNSCETEIIELHYGWDCTPYTSPNLTPCRDEAIILTATSPVGELEMEVTSPIGTTDLCDEIDYHTVEIFDAQLGNVFDVFLELTIPLGLNIVPGSCQISYPTGNAFTDIPDPDLVAGNTFQWDVSSLNTILETSGLAGVSQAPNNSVSIRFKTTTECGFVAGSQIVFNTIGKQNCNEPTNTITKAGEPINITGIVPAYNSDVNVAINTSTAITCGAEVNLSISILPDGMTTNSDSVLITLPPGVTFIPGSYVPNSNAPATQPAVVTNAGQQILKIEIPPGTPAFSLISFEIGTTGFGAFGCGDQVIQILSVQRQDAVCSTTGESCYVLSATGTSTITISSDHPDLSLQNLDVTAYGDSITYSLDIANAGVETSPPLQVDFYIDNDGDGMLSPGDILVSSEFYNSIINNGDVITFTGNFMGSIEDLCNLIAVIDETENCVCGTEAIQVNSPVNSVLPPQAVCSGVPIEIGVPSEPGHVYSWDPPLNLSSTSSSLTTFEFINTSQDSASFVYTLIDQSATCEVNHSITVNVFPFIGMNTQEVEICAGEELTLSVIQGGSYVWEGPNITNPNQATQTVTLFEDATYNVAITLAEGCNGSEEINVTVLPFQESFSSMITCPEDPVDIFGQLISTPGMYCDTFPTLNGCDSMICIELENFVSYTEDRFSLCPGDSVEVNGTVYYTAQDICDTNISSFGCDSTHCFIIEAVDTPMVEIIPDTIIAEGQEIGLYATAGFPNYSWSPAGGLSCTNCPNPVITLNETTDFSLTVTDDNGCISNLGVLITVLPPCNPQRLQIPNVFTPDNDGNNDTFGVYDFEGFEMVNSIKIFNRWGEKIYEDAGAGAKWDGTQKGKPAPTDVYVYIIRVECEDGIGTLHGDITLIR